MTAQKSNYHAVLIDECGDEFGVSVHANSKHEAYEKLREDYPESGVLDIYARASDYGYENKDDF